MWIKCGFEMTCGLLGIDFLSGHKAFHVPVAVNDNF